MPTDHITSGDGLRLAVHEQGPADAPPVVLVHGYPDNSSVWDGVAEDLAADHRVIRYDVRGAGDSDAPPGRWGYRLDHLAADLAGLVRATSPNRPVHLLAHDWGSIQTWHAITEPAYEHLFASYTTMSGPCLDHVALWLRENLRAHRYGPLANQLLHSWYIGAFHVPALPEWAFSSPSVSERFHARPRDARNGLELYRANMLRRARSPQPRRTNVPVQQIVLTRDAFVRPAVLESADPYCATLTRRELDSSHWAPRTHPEQVAAMTRKMSQYGVDCY
jgi:pimeloyl-ACP methyl ester carboxylesterase